jgi:hypothetical protein
MELPVTSKVVDLRVRHAADPPPVEGCSKKFYDRSQTPEIDLYFGHVLKGVAETLRRYRGSLGELPNLAKLRSFLAPLVELDPGLAFHPHFGVEEDKHPVKPGLFLREEEHLVDVPVSISDLDRKLDKLVWAANLESVGTKPTGIPIFDGKPNPFLHRSADERPLKYIEHGTPLFPGDRYASLRAIQEGDNTIHVVPFPASSQTASEDSILPSQAGVSTEDSSSLEKKSTPVIDDLFGGRKFSWA